jgi:OFA family oxalate/formate antiporter-like MFS transporter
MKNRWLVVVGALIVQLCLGAIYAWSVFVNPLKETYGFSTTETQLIFSLGLASFAVTMILAGRWQDRKGPRLVATVGGVVLGLGYLIGGLSGGSFLAIALGVGVIGGAGIGLGYVCPIAACMKCFPDKRGLVTGLAVAGFGAGAWIFARIAEVVIAGDGVLKAFLWLGIIFTALVVGGAQLLKNPPAGWKPACLLNEKKKGTDDSKEDFEWREMIKTRQFWMLWVMFTFGALAGLMVIGILKPFGIFSGLSAIVAGSAVGVLAIFNGAGRVAWGVASDKIGRHKAMGIMFALQGVMMLALMQMGSSELTLALAAAWVGFNFGGNFALFPSATADYFGTKNLGMNYGLVFTSYGVAGIVGPILGGAVFDATGSYLWAFIPAGILCLIAAGLAFVIKTPHHKRN